MMSWCIFWFLLLLYLWKFFKFFYSLWFNCDYLGLFWSFYSDSSILLSYWFKFSKNTSFGDFYSSTSCIVFCCNLFRYTFELASEELFYDLSGLVGIVKLTTLTYFYFLTYLLGESKFNSGTMSKLWGTDYLTFGDNYCFTLIAFFWLFRTVPFSALIMPEFVLLGLRIGLKIICVFIFTGWFTVTFFFFSFSSFCRSNIPALFLLF